MALVNRNLRHNRLRRIDQGQVWDSIEEKRARMNCTEAPTGAMDDLYVHAALRLGDYERDLKPAPKKVGAVFAIDGKVSGFDLFDDAGHCAKYFSKLMRSQVLDAMETASEAAAPTRESVTALFKGFDNAAEEVHDAVGLGLDLPRRGPGNHRCRTGVGRPLHPPSEVSEGCLMRI